MARQDVRPARSASCTDTYFALSGLMLCLVALPRAKPWAITYGPFRAGYEHLVIVGSTLTTQSNPPEPDIISRDGHANFMALRYSGDDDMGFEVCPRMVGWISPVRATGWEKIVMSAPDRSPTGCVAFGIRPRYVA